MTSYMWLITRLWSLLRYNGYSWRHICDHLPDMISITIIRILVTSYMCSITRLWSLLCYYGHSWRHICDQLPDCGPYYAITDTRYVIYVVIYQTVVASTLLGILVTSYMWSFARLWSYYALTDTRDVIYAVIYQTVVPIKLSRDFIYGL